MQQVENQGQRADMAARLRRVGLRPTRQRLDLCRLLFAKGDRHVTAEWLHADAVAAGVKISLATVYNTLHQFTEAGLLRQIVVDGARTYFDTNTSDHPHFYLKESGGLSDVPDGGVRVSGLPCPPEGTEIEQVDIIVRLRRKQDAG